ncbi:hypothetical protein [Streptomyces venezuelae]|uniref:hypothetical protein n=1 Tax=Streptomyces venezuelae TaxID=54571 RepID=UPI00123A833E|nr:hypothetical protein [Streptomyces venezuelae]
MPRAVGVPGAVNLLGALSVPRPVSMHGAVRMPEAARTPGAVHIPDAPRVHEARAGRPTPQRPQSQHRLLAQAQRMTSRCQDPHLRGPVEERPYDAHALTPYRIEVVQHHEHPPRLQPVHELRDPDGPGPEPAPGLGPRPGPGP